MDLGSVRNRFDGFLVSHTRLVGRFDLVSAANCATGHGKEEELAAWVRPPSSEMRLRCLCRSKGKLHAKRVAAIVFVLSCRA